MRTIEHCQPLRQAILRWHDQNARDLPWRGETDPYRIWVSEIMLQQTRAETVIPYYRRFLAHYPTVEALAAAGQDQVYKDWEGLGYYSRARNLHKAAQVVALSLGGRFPSDVKGLRGLPGVGAYTAGAIASMAFSLPEPAIDGNQVRVLTRLFAIAGDTGRPQTKARIGQCALALMDLDRPGDFNQALMGLGALICLPRRPRCDDCPAKAWCRARALNLVGELPRLPEKIKQKVEKRAVALVFWDNKVLVRKRPDEGLLGGLWEFPNFPNARSDAAVREALGEMGVAVTAHRPGPSARHVFTHLIWQMTGHIYRAQSGGGAGRYVDAGQLSELAMGTAHKVYREEALARL